MRFSRPPIWALALLAPLTACSSSDGSGASSLFITSCSLGCSSGNGGSQVFCSVVNTARNQELAINFNDAVDPGSLNSSSFRVVNTNNGATPVGTFFVDPTDPRRLVFRPALDFALDGSPIFGFEEDAAYRITIPGLALAGEDGGPFIQSPSGRRNVSPLECTILTDQPLVDPVPGAPNVEVFVDALTGQTDGMGNPITTTISLDGADVDAERISRFSPITMRFDDIMNPATLANPVTRTSDFVFVQVDEDGDLTTTDDRTDVAGSFTVTVDQDLLITTMVFDHEVLETDGTVTPTLGFPSSGEDQTNPRRIVLTLSSTVRDIASLPVTENADGLSFAFVSEAVPIPPLILPGGVEDVTGIDPFTNGSESFEFSNSDLSDFFVGAGQTSSEDSARSGAFWGNGRLAPGIGGGSGRLGDLIIRQGQTVTLSTDSQEFPVGQQVTDLLQNGGVNDPITIEGGNFEFGSLTIEGGGRLVLEGSRPARIFVRGDVDIQDDGILDLSGGTPEAHDSRHPEPMIDWLDDMGMLIAEAQVPGVGGPGGGRGGFGGTRHGFDETDGFADDFLDLGGLSDAGPELPLGWTTADRNGRLGEPVRAIDENGTVVGNDASTPGQGGSVFPSVFPGSVAAALWMEGQWNSILDPSFEPDQSCLVRMVGGVGSGGAYAMDAPLAFGRSTEQTADFPLATTPSNNPPDTNGGVSDLMVAEPPSLTNDAYSLRTLEFDPLAGVPRYNLRGGAGGGGGGNHPYNSYSSGQLDSDLDDCDNITSEFETDGGNVVLPWQDHSGAAGGGGGGALQLTAGRRIVVDGLIDASGGDGGSAADLIDVRGLHAAPGGGGSGGAVLLQGQDVSLGAALGRIDVNGGIGGSWLSTSNGGAGGPGLVRIETSSGDPLDGTATAHQGFAQSITPFDSMNIAFGDGSVNILSVVPGSDDWYEPKFLPDAYSGSVSCWQQPPGNFFEIGFAEDAGDVSTTAPSELAWNMTVILDDGAGGEMTQPFRGAGGVVNEFLNNINYDLDDLPMGEDTPSVLSIRFQGARTLSDLDDVCIGTAPPIIPGSVTPWVEHPSELNPGPDDTFPEPNYFRYAIFFDPSAGLASADLLEFSRSLRGVTNLWIRADPD